MFEIPESNRNNCVAWTDAYLLFTTFATEAQLREATRRITDIRRRHIWSRCSISHFNPHLNDIESINAQTTAYVAQLAGVADIAIQFSLHGSVDHISNWHFDRFVFESLGNIAVLRCHPPAPLETRHVLRGLTAMKMLPLSLC